AGAADAAVDLPDPMRLPQTGRRRTHRARPVAATAADSGRHGRAIEAGPGLPGVLLHRRPRRRTALPVIDARCPGHRRAARLRGPEPGHARPHDRLRPVLRAAVGPVLAYAGPGRLARPADAPGT